MTQELLGLEVLGCHQLVLLVDYEHGSCFEDAQRVQKKPDTLKCDGETYNTNKRIENGALDSRIDPGFAAHRSRIDISPDAFAAGECRAVRWLLQREDVRVEALPSVERDVAGRYVLVVDAASCALARWLPNGFPYRDVVF